MSVGLQPLLEWGHRPLIGVRSTYPIGNCSIIDRHRRNYPDAATCVPNRRSFMLRRARAVYSTMANTSTTSPIAPASSIDAPMAGISPPITASPSSTIGRRPVTEPRSRTKPCEASQSAEAAASLATITVNSSTL